MIVSKTWKGAISGSEKLETSTLVNLSIWVKLEHMCSGRNGALVLSELGISPYCQIPQLHQGTERREHLANRPSPNPRRSLLLRGAMSLRLI